MSIGTAKPTAAQRAQVPYYFVHTHHITEPMSAQVFVDYAQPVLDRLFARDQNVLIVGGTGLYLRSLTDGLSAIPPIPPSLRAHLQHEYLNNGKEWLQRTLAQEDKDFFVHANASDAQNPARMLRALAVIRHCQRGIHSFHQQRRPVNNTIRFRKFALYVERERLHANIASRFHKMIEDGLVQEVKTLTAYQHFHPLHSIGYREKFPYVAGEYSLETAIDLAIQHSRQYAKRQHTWLKKDKEISWVDNTNHQAISYIRELV